jgi:hypothetical protein
MGIVPPPFSPILGGLVFALPKWLSTRVMSWYSSDEEYEHMVGSKDLAIQATGYFGLQTTQVRFFA